MSNWTIIVEAAVDEFSDLNDIQFLVPVVIRLLLAMLLGGIIGYEREHQGKAAGLRTHVLVCLGATLFILVGGGSTTLSDPVSRIVQGVIAGIGFLGAGTILKHAHDVRGLTTAASIWFTAAIGVGIGLGHVALSILSTLFAVLVLHCLPRVVDRVKNDQVNDNDE